MHSGKIEATTKKAKALNSKYVEFGTLSFADFAKSKKGTQATYLLSIAKNARKEVSKTLKSACVKSGSTCELNATNILIEQENGSWHPSHVLKAVILTVKT